MADVCDKLSCALLCPCRPQLLAVSRGLEGRMIHIQLPKLYVLKCADQHSNGFSDVLLRFAEISTTLYRLQVCRPSIWTDRLLPLVAELFII